MMFSAQRVVTFNEAVSRTALLTRLAQSLLADGLVKPSFTDGVLAREESTRRGSLWRPTASPFRIPSLSMLTTPGLPSVSIGPAWRFSVPMSRKRGGAGDRGHDGH
jgi:hypothetical protein